MDSKYQLLIGYIVFFSIIYLGIYTIGLSVNDYVDQDKNGSTVILFVILSAVTFCFSYLTLISDINNVKFYGSIVLLVLSAVFDIIAQYYIGIKDPDTIGHTAFTCPCDDGSTKIVNCPKCVKNSGSLIAIHVTLVIFKLLAYGGIIQFMRGGLL